MTANTQPTTIEEYYLEWEKTINELKDKEIDLINTKETYNQLEQDIINNTDFKALYGANNQKIRDNHVKKELKDIVNKKQDLEIEIHYLKRRIDYIKSVLSMQKTLINAGVIE